MLYTNTINSYLNFPKIKFFRVFRKKDKNLKKKLAQGDKLFTLKISN